MTNQSPPARPDGDALLPCPFCGTNNRLTPSEGMFYLQCRECGIVTGDFETAQMAVDFWNTRATSPARDAAEGRDDPTASTEWNAGCDFAMTQLCTFLGVDSAAVTWDAATETVDGDVRAVIGNILRAKFGEDWGPSAPPKPAPDAVRKALKTIANGTFPWTNLNAYQMAEIARAAVPAPAPPERELHGSSVPPDRVGAAEPVAWQPGQSIEGRAHSLLDRELTNDPAQPTVAALRAIGVALQGELKCIDALRAVWDDWTIANDESGMDEYEIRDVAPETVQKVQSALRGRLYATPPVRGDREAIAREIVTEWLGMFDPPPQIDFQQSEFLQGAIASALAIPRTALPVQPGAGERE